MQELSLISQASLYVLLGIMGLICLIIWGWLGQAITALSPKKAAKLGMTEYESDVDPTFWADVRGESVWDTMILWTLPVAGILLILNISLWAYFGLAGGGMYLYFAGRGILTRLAMQRRGICIGMPKTLTVNYVFMIIWGLIAVVTIIMAVAALPLPE